jgi:hypothetical protein
MSDYGKKPTGAGLMVKCNGTLTYGFQMGETGAKRRGGPDEHKSGGGMGGGNAPKPSYNPASAKTPAFSVIPQTPSLLSRLVISFGNLLQDRFPHASIFIGKGREASATVFADPTRSFKTGYSIGKYDRITVTMELINYDEKEKEVYLTLDYEYLPNAPKGYLDVGIGAINSDGCGAMAIRTRFFS